MAKRENVVQRINSELADGWEAKLDHSGRIYYISHKSQTTSWLPPRENWGSNTALPYGWETGVDRNDKEYFINHVDRYSTRDDPRLDPDYIEPPRPRQVELLRDPDKGFGFVAGSERPVVVRFVTEGGPSEDKLLPGDQILRINGEEVRRAPRERVIDLVRSCKQSIILTVCQPYTDNSSRKSALLTAAKKAKLKNNPSRVRFADAVMVNGASIVNTENSPSPVESYVPFMPNVLKVFLENGQTKSFKYDNKTTVRDVVVSLQEKLSITCVHHFSLVVQNMKANTGTAAKMTLLHDHETLAEIAARPGARHFRCLFRVTFVPKDAYDLLKDDPIAFEYFYLQCCNDVLHERFASEMKYDTALRLAALHIQQHAVSSNTAAKISIKAIVKECGLEKFVSKSLRESMKGKDLKRMLAQYLKMNHSLAAPGQKQLTALQAKLHYMKIISELKTFGSRVFMVTLLDRKSEAMLLVGPHSGISIVTNIKSYSLAQLADFENIEILRLAKDGENMNRVDIKLKGQRSETISLGLLSDDAHNFVGMVAGYYRIFVDPERRVVERTLGKNTSDPDVPSYECLHRVQAEPWSYPEDLVSQVVGTSSAAVSDNQRLLDLSHDPPDYVLNEEYINTIKEDLGIANSDVTDRGDNCATAGMVEMQPMSAVSSRPNMNGLGMSFEEGVTSFGASPSSAHRASLNSNGSLSGRSAFSPALDLWKVDSASTNGHASSPSVAAGIQDCRLESERSSDTDSLSLVDAERKPLLAQANQVNGNFRNSLDESDDTDSFGTPTSSPAKGRHLQRMSSVESGMHSFGLHSPDTLPAADVDFQQMNDCDTYTLPSELYNAAYNTASMLPSQNFYFDPDIIDLTVLPPLDVVDDDSVIDFTALPSFLPPTLSAPASPSGHRPGDLALPLPADFEDSRAVPHLESSGGSDIFGSDIDSLIAQFYVPPPPSSTLCVHAEVLSQGGSETGEFSGYHRHRPVTFDEDLSSLIIPPPPATSQVDDVPVDRRRKFRHKRSSSVDIGALTLANRQIEASEKRRSLDSQEQQKRTTGGGADTRHAQPPHELENLGKVDSALHDDLEVESPATVAAKLHSLLMSLPTFVPEQQLQQQQHFRRTGSLRITRSASVDVIPGAQTPPAAADGDAPQVFSGRSVLRTLLSGTASLGRRSGRRAVSRDQLWSEPSLPGPQLPNGAVHEGRSDPPPSTAESFASLKAKLKDYRDSLLQRSRRKSESLGEAEAGEDAERKGGLKRSNSFTRIMAQLTGRHKSRSRDTSPVSADGNWTLRQKAPDASPQSSVTDVTSFGAAPGGEPEEQGGEKRAPVVREMFAVPRTSLRPVWTAGGNQTDVEAGQKDAVPQTKSRKSGPLKALSSVLSGDQKGSDAKLGNTDVKLGNTAPGRPLPSPAGSQQLHGSKDDLSMTSRGKKKAKAKANPYATIKMWRPMADNSGVSRDENVYQDFTNFDTLLDQHRLPATGHLHPEEDWETGVGSGGGAAWQGSRGSDSESGRSLSPPRDFSLDGDSPPTERSAAAFSQSQRQRGRSPTRRARQMAPPPPTQTVVNGDVDIPADYSRDTTPSTRSQRSRSLSSDAREAHIQRGPAALDSSYAVVSPSASACVRDVLRKTYDLQQLEAAGGDVDRLLAQLKLTMEGLQAAQAAASSSDSQFHAVQQELHQQTKDFVNDAKRLVAATSSTRETAAQQLHAAMHSLARLFLLAQATMTRMRSVHQAQHAGFEVIKVANSFKSTVSASSAAIGKPRDDPHVQYLMRQAQNLAALLSTLLKTVKSLPPGP